MGVGDDVVDIKLSSKDKTKIVLATVIAVVILCNVFVVRHFMGDLWLRRGKAVLAETEGRADSSGDGPIKGYMQVEKNLKKALSWDDKNADCHYWLARLYQILTHRYARKEGRWEEASGIFVDGARSSNYAQLAIEAFYRAINRNPASQYFHLELASLLKSKLSTVAMTADEAIDYEGKHSQKVLSVYNTFKEFERATNLAPNRTLHRMSFGDFIIERMVDAEGRGGLQMRARDSYTWLLNRAVEEYARALALTPTRVDDVLRSLTRVTTHYDKLRQVIPETNKGLKEMVLSLSDMKGEDEVTAAFYMDMKTFLARYDGSPESVETLFPYYDTLTELYLKKGQYGRASAALEEYLTHDPESADTHARIAAIETEREHYEKARIYLFRAMNLDPENGSYRRKLVSVIQAESDPVAAETMLTRLVKLYPDDPYMYEGLAENYVKRGQIDKAESIYRKILSRTKDKARGYYLLGRLYDGQGNEKKAAQYLKRAALLNRRYQQTFSNMFSVDVILREYFKTTRKYERLKELIHLTPESLYRLGLFLYQEGAWNINRKAIMTDMKRAEERFVRLQLEGKPLKQSRSWLFAFYRTLSEIYIRKDEPCKSMEILRKLTIMDPENYQAWFALARVSGKHTSQCGYAVRDVERFYEKAISGELKNTIYLKGYVKFLSETGIFDKAERLAEYLLELDSKDPEVHEILGYVYEKSGRIKEAIDALSKAVSLSPGKERYKEKLSELMKRE